jgi:hypothetical protein
MNVEQLDALVARKSRVGGARCRRCNSSILWRDDPARFVCLSNLALDEEDVVGNLDVLRVQRAPERQAPSGSSASGSEEPSRLSRSRGTLPRTFQGPGSAARPRRP